MHKFEVFLSEANPYVWYLHCGAIVVYSSSRDWSVTHFTHVTPANNFSRWRHNPVCGVSSAFLPFNWDTSALCNTVCLQSLLAWRKVLFGNVYLQSNLYRVGPPKHHLGQLVSNLLCQAFLALSLPQPCEPPYLYMGPHLVYLDQIMARMLLIDRTCCASSPKGSRCHSSIQVKLLCKTLIWITALQESWFLQASDTILLRAQPGTAIWSLMKMM